MQVDRTGKVAVVVGASQGGCCIPSTRRRGARKSIFDPSKSNFEGEGQPDQCQAQSLRLTIFSL